jgi:hypothetical protein
MEDMFLSASFRPHAVKVKGQQVLTLPQYSDNTPGILALESHVPRKLAGAELPNDSVASLRKLWAMIQTFACSADGIVYIHGLRDNFCAF